MNALEQFIIMPMQQVFLIGCAVAGIYWLILYDNGSNLLAQTSQLRGQIGQTQTELKRKRLSLNRSKQFKETLRIKDEQFQAFSSYIPESLTVADMMRVISNEAKAAGVNIAGIKAGTAKSAVATSLTQPIAIDVNLLGSFPQQILFLSFLSRLESIFTVSDMSFTTKAGSAGQNDEGVSVEFSGKIVGYRYIGDGSGGGK